MSRGMNTPLNQVRHSNVAVVRLTVKGKRLEIACYKNKVVSFRNGTEERLDEVLQTDRVFSNVSRGEFAPLSDIRAALGNDITEREALAYILKHGDLQVAQHERHFEIDETMKDVCTIVAQKCVHPVSLRPYSVAMIEQTIRSMGVSLRRDTPAKAQALRIIKDLCAAQPIPIRRAQMRVSCTIDGSLLGELKNVVGDGLGDIESQSSTESSSIITVVFTMNPELFRTVDEWAKSHGGTVTVIDTVVMDTSQGDAEGIEAMLAAAQPDSRNLTKSEDNTTAPKHNPAGPKSVGSREEDDLEVAPSVVADLEAKLQAVVIGQDDEEDSTKKKKPKKPAKKKAPKQKKQTEESDEDVVSERKKKKVAVEEEEEDESWKDGLDGDDE